jgi:hypothetical protein
MRRAHPLVALVAALLATGCGTAASVTRTSAQATPTGSTAAAQIAPANSSARRLDRRPRATPAGVNRSAQASVVSAAGVAAAFSNAYARYLDGRLPVAALPDTSAAALTEIGPVIPRAGRAGEPAVHSVRQTTGAFTYAAQLRDHAHTFPVQLTVGLAGRRWLVTSIDPPDIDTILHSHSIPIPQPSGSGPAEHAARAFMAGYLQWLYGAGPVGAIRDATSQLIALLKANPPNIPPTFQGLHGRLDSLGLRSSGDGWRAFALVTDPHTSYNLVMSVTLERGRWLVTSVGLAS